MDQNEIVERIEKVVKKFEETMGPVARRIASEIAEEMKILKEIGGEKKIAPESEEGMNSFFERLRLEYGKIIGEKVVETLFKIALEQ